MANAYVTGPCHLYVAPGILQASSSGTLAPALLNYCSAASIFYLGTCETVPKIIIDPKWKPLFADIGGDQTPFEFAWMGEDGLVTGVLNRWNESVYKKCATRPRPTGTRGTYTASDIGTLMFAEAVAYPLWCHFPYYSKVYGTLYNMPAGYRFLASFLRGPDEIEPGTKASRRAIVFAAAPIYKPSDGTWKLYDENMTYIPSVPPTVATGAVV